MTTPLLEALSADTAARREWATQELITIVRRHAEPEPHDGARLRELLDELGMTEGEVRQMIAAMNRWQQLQHQLTPPEDIEEARQRAAQVTRETWETWRTFAIGRINRAHGEALQRFLNGSLPLIHEIDLRESVAQMGHAQSIARDIEQTNASTREQMNALEQKYPALFQN